MKERKWKSCFVDHTWILPASSTTPPLISIDNYVMNVVMLEVHPVTLNEILQNTHGTAKVFQCQMLLASLLR
jgi:hypothetical protein